MTIQEALIKFHRRHSRESGNPAPFAQHIETQRRWVPDIASRFRDDEQDQTFLHGEFNWNELQTQRVDDAIAFYRDTVGWRFRPEGMPSGDTYWIGLSSGKPVCGLLTLDGDEGNSVPDRCITYVHVDGLDDAVARVQACGGKVLRAPWDVAGVGRVAMIRDPGGAEPGWVTPVPRSG